MGISFTKRLRPAIRRGEVTLSVRFWFNPRVRVGERSAMEEGHVRVTGLRQMSLDEITDELSVQSGFTDAEDMLKVAKHGASDLIWLVEFVYEPPGFDCSEVTLQTHV